jgi:hypothetical protein
VYITSNDSIAVNIVTDTLIFKSFSGFLGDDTLGFDPIIEEDIADYEGFEGGIELSEAFLNLKIYSEILIDNLTANIVITGFHRNESGVITDSARPAGDHGNFPDGAGNCRFFKHSAYCYPGKWKSESIRGSGDCAGEPYLGGLFIRNPL